MEICVFDMDGVLIKSGGYHQALKETVLLAGKEIGYDDVLLTDAQIAQFEALGISSEWHSSALCKAVMMLQKSEAQSSKNGKLDLTELFEGIATQPMQIAPMIRGIAAVEKIAQTHGYDAENALQVLRESESIQVSETLNTFEELILGSSRFRKVYKKESRFNTESYLIKYDIKLLHEDSAKKILQWVKKLGHGAAMMTNRPSLGPRDFGRSPDAQIGLELIGLESLTVIGQGEISWLAHRTGIDTEKIRKPGRAHALAAILAASGMPIEQSLEDSVLRSIDLRNKEIGHLKGSTIIVYEDTPGGIVAVQEAVDLLNKIGLAVNIKKFGVADDAAKEKALSAQGAKVYPDINQALENLLID